MVDISDADRIAKSTLRGLDVDERSANYEYVMDRISSMSRHGATEREIKDSIEKEILETAVPINGMLVFAKSDLPPDFPELMEIELQARFALAEGIANRLQQNLDERLARDSGIVSDEAKALERAIKGGQVRADEHTKATRDWLKNLIPQVRIGDRTFFDN